MATKQVDEHRESNEVDDGDGVETEQDDSQTLSIEHPFNPEKNKSSNC